MLMKQTSIAVLKRDMRALQRRHFLTLWFSLSLLLSFAVHTASQPPITSSLPDFAETTQDSIVFIKIPAGKYRRGTTEAEVGELTKKGWWRPYNKDEQPAQEVTISRPFLVGKYEVTQKQWRAVMGDKNPSAFKGEELPVESVTWNDVKIFCKTLSEKTKATYRLPTEAEWEYSARAGGESSFGMGSNKQPISPDTLGEYAWMSTTSGYKTHPTGQKKPNAWGIFDMLGNVWEWCEDGYSPTAYSTMPVTDPRQSLEKSTERVFRGGCWYLDGRAQRVAIRGGNLPEFKSPYVGFRLVREL